ncbi:hypothetical protein BH11PLA1_BH11PLA1_00700 [soil metagenome]
MIRFVRDMARVLTMPCREHVVLFSRQLDAPLPRGAAFGLRLHIVYCGGCRRFRAHLRHMQALGGVLAEQGENEPGLPADVRARLNARVALGSNKN